MKPTKVEFDIGETRFKQSLRLVLERGSDGVLGWTFIKEAVSSRDDRQSISGIPAETILRMAEAVKSIK